MSLRGGFVFWERPSAVGFRYLRDPLFLECLGAYFVNRWLVKPSVDWWFFHNYFNDLICIPFWVPIMVWGMHRVGMRPGHDAPEWHEILLPVVVWSVFFEVWLPGVAGFEKVAHGDAWDVVFYGVGAGVAWGFWRVWYGDGTRREATRKRTD